MTKNVMKFKFNEPNNNNYNKEYREYRNSR